MDYNNDGIFDDATETIADSGGHVEEFTNTFTPPANAVTNRALRMRVAANRATTAPPTCNVTSGGRQTVDIFIQINTQPTITNNHHGVAANSATIASTYTGATNVREAGILYSPFDIKLNENNTTKIAQTGSLGTNESFDTPLSNLEYNVTYYYQTYVLDDGGFNFSERKSFTLTPFNIPTAESIQATNMGGTQWQLKGFVMPEGNDLTEVTLEHGENSFGNSTAIDLTNLDVNNTLQVNEIIDVGAASTYQFRIKVVVNNKTFYSNILPFTPNQTYCAPTVNNYLWYKRFTGLTYGDFSYYTHASAATRYEDLTNQKLAAFEMGQSYTLTMRGRMGDGNWNNLSYIAYIDLNNDQDFEDYNEIVGSVGANGQQFSELTITIPTEDVITERNLRMRIVGHEGGNVTSCNTPVGNFKDFTISIKAGACTGTGHIVSFFEDNDMDGFGNPNVVVLRNCTVTSLAGYALVKGDCDDTNPNVHPNAPEICNDGIDNNCDGYTDDANLALGKTTKQSSTLNHVDNPNASRANDGNTSGLWTSKSITHTNTENNPWWELDLGASHQLDSIVIWNRTDCCGDRLDDFYVFFSDTPFSSLDPAITAGQSGVWSIFTSSPVGTKIRFEPTNTGQYLRVQINGNGILSLAEVQTFACVPTSTCTFYADTDGDGYGDPNQTMSQSCAVNPVGYVMDNTDFDDTDNTRYPNAPELCDNKDNNGDNQVDEGATYDSEYILLSNEHLYQETHSASTTIETNQMVKVVSDGDVQLFAGQSIDLKPGFDVQAGGLFTAAIAENCTGGTLMATIPAVIRTQVETETTLEETGLDLSISPNPFQDQAIIDFNLPETTKVSLHVFALNGELIETIIADKSYPAGKANVAYAPKQSANGFYYFVLKTETEMRTQKAVIIGK
ncbi:MAG: GEVED domain-containing protein [Bacteroidota bacterium]